MLLICKFILYDIDMRHITLKFVLTIALAALLWLSAAIFVMPISAAYAEEGNLKTVIRVGVDASTLENEPYAGRSAVALNVYANTSNDVFYVPTSYFLEGPSQPYPSVAPNIWSVKYAGEEFLLPQESLLPKEEGYVKTEKITVSEGELLYPDVKLTLKDGVTIGDGTKQYDNSSTISFLGYGKDASKIYIKAVDPSGAKYLDFVTLDSFLPFEVPYQARAQKQREDILANKTNSTTPEAGELQPSSSKALRVVLIIGIALPAVIVMLLLFLPTRGDRVYGNRSATMSDPSAVDYDDTRKREE